MGYNHPGIEPEGQPQYYRAPGKSMYFLLSRTQAGPGRTVKQEQEEISRNHVQTFISPSVYSQTSQSSEIASSQWLER